MDSIISFFKSTMLIERLLGVGVYVLMLGYYYNRIQHAGNARAIKRALDHYLIVLCIMAFLYIPGTSADLYRWRNIAESWKNVSFAWFWNQRVITSSTPLGYLLIYICQMTGINGLLPMVCAFGFYSNVFHILKCEAMRDESSPDSIAISLFFFMSNGVFLEVISGIRCMLSFAIVLRCVYDELYMSKGLVKHLPLYVVAGLLHNAALPLVGCRLLCILLENRRNAVLTVFNILTVILISFAAVRLGNDYIDAAFAKAESYTSHNVYSYSWEYVIATLGLIVLILVLWKHKKRYPNQWHKEINGLRYLIFLLIGDIAFVGTYSIFHRYFIAAMIISIPVVLSFLTMERKSELKRTRTEIVYMSMIILFFACVRGNLCGYKFFLLK